MLKAVNSHTNFALLDPLRPAQMVLDHLKHNNVILPPLFPGREQYVRVSFGTPDEMREFWRVMDLLPPTGKMDSSSTIVKSDYVVLTSATPFVFLKPDARIRREVPETICEPSHPFATMRSNKPTPVQVE
jgi:hypothetical protein